VKLSPKQFWFAEAILTKLFVEATKSSSACVEVRVYSLEAPLTVFKGLF